MKVISIWQPWASLIVHGMKFFETRTWPAPASVIGQRIGIAATKNITPDQRSTYHEERFQFFYEQSGLPPLEELPRGHLLGTVVLDSVERIDEDFLEEITLEERAFGWYQLGGYAWRLRHHRLLEHPIPIQGRQGIFEWKGFENGSAENMEEEARRVAEAARAQGPDHLRGRLHAV